MSTDTTERRRRRTDRRRGAQHELESELAEPHSGARALRSAPVRRALEAGWTAAGPAAVSWFTYRHRMRDAGPYHFVNVRAGDHEVQISVSPTGRSVRVFVDGQEA